jgi:single-strand DNA-binding protein
MQNINVVVITGNLTQDPELRHTGSETAVCELRVAVNSRRKDGATGEWVDKPNYFNVTVWGAQGENCSEYLAKGRPVAVEGRLDWSEWEAKDGSGKRQGVKIIANSVQFLGQAPANGNTASATTPEESGDRQRAEGRTTFLSSHYDQQTRARLRCRAFVVLWEDVRLTAIPQSC